MTAWVVRRVAYALEVPGEALLWLAGRLPSRLAFEVGYRLLLPSLYLHRLAWRLDP